MTDAAPDVPQTLTERVAAEVRAELARQNLNQRQIAEILGVAQPNVSLRLTGKRPFDTAELDKIAAALDVPVDRFLKAPSANLAGAA